MIFIKLIVLAAVLSLTGCATLLKMQGQAEEKIAQGVGDYCKIDAGSREKFELDVNAKAFPNSVSILCK